NLSFVSSRRRHTRSKRDWSSDVCSSDLFHAVKNEFRNAIYAYYFDIPFGETLNRHKKRAKVSDFGEKEMRRWWREKDCLKLIPETIIDEKMSKEKIVQTIKNDVFSIN